MIYNAINVDKIQKPHNERIYIKLTNDEFNQKINPRGNITKRLRTEKRKPRTTTTSKI